MPFLKEPQLRSHPIWEADIVTIHSRNEIALRFEQHRVEPMCDTLIDMTTHGANSLIYGRQLIEDFLSLVGRTVIEDQNLQITVGLVANALHSLL